MTVVFRLYFPLMGRTQVWPDNEMSLWLFLCVLSLSGSITKIEQENQCLISYQVLCVCQPRRDYQNREGLCHWLKCWRMANWEFDMWEHTLNNWCDSDNTKTNYPVFLNFPSVLYSLVPVHACVCIWPILCKEPSVLFANVINLYVYVCVGCGRGSCGAWAGECYCLASACCLCGGSWAWPPHTAATSVSHTHTDNSQEQKHHLLAQSLVTHCWATAEGMLVLDMAIISRTWSVFLRPQTHSFNLHLLSDLQRMNKTAHIPAWWFRYSYTVLPKATSVNINTINIIQ